MLSRESPLKVEVIRMFNKEWYKSKTVWACVFTMGVSIASTMWGETNEVVVLAVTVGSMFGIYGRVRADTTLV